MRDPLDGVTWFRGSSVRIRRDGVEIHVDPLGVTEASAAGVWRFELGDAVEPGSLAVQAGDVQVVTGDSVVFRVRGTAGERLVFTFRRRIRGREGER